MAEHPHPHSDQSKAKISFSMRRVWQDRLKSKRLGEKFLLSWEQSIANAAKKGESGQGELDWDSYDKIKQQLELQQLLQDEEKKKEKLMGIARAKKFIQSWGESIAKAAKKGGSGEQVLDWDSYEKTQQEMVLLYQLRHTAEKAKAKEMAKVKAEKAATVKAIKKVMLSKRRKDCLGRTKARWDIKSQPHRKAKEGKGDLEVAQELKLHPKALDQGAREAQYKDIYHRNAILKIHIGKNMSSQVAGGDIFKSIFPNHMKLDLELIKREKMQKEVSLTDQIQAARDKKGKLGS